MITIHNIDETIRLYGSLGAQRLETGNGSLFTFGDPSSYVRFWGDLHGFCVAAVDMVFPRDLITRSQFHERYIGISFMEEGRVVTYNKKAEPRESHTGIDCYVFNSPAPLFMRLLGGQRLRFRGMYFQESFFRENGLRLQDSFWEDAKRSIAGSALHSPELLSIFQRIERCPLTGEPFQIWMRGQGLAATGHLLHLVQCRAAVPPVYLTEEDVAAASRAKQIITENIAGVPTVLELCKQVALNKNKLQKAFRLTEGKNIGEYIRVVRMEMALDLLEKSDMSIQEIAEATGCRSLSNFYRLFQQKFGETPQAVRRLLQKG